MREWLKHFFFLHHKIFESFWLKQMVVWPPGCGPGFSSRPELSLDPGGAGQPEAGDQGEGQEGTEDGKLVAGVAGVEVVAALDAASDVSESRIRSSASCEIND